MGSNFEQYKRKVRRYIKENSSRFNPNQHRLSQNIEDMLIDLEELMKQAKEASLAIDSELISIYEEFK